MEKGFTLIELLTIIAIIGILVLIGIPALRSYQPNLQLGGAARNLVSDLRFTQQLTVTEQKEYCLQFFIAEKKYQIIQCGQTEPLKEVFLPDKIETLVVIGFTNNEVRFNPYGAVKETGTVTLINTKNATTTIDVRPSGFVKIIK